MSLVCAVQFHVKLALDYLDYDQIAFFLVAVPFSHVSLCGLGERLAGKAPGQIVSPKSI